MFNIRNILFISIIGFVGLKTVQSQNTWHYAVSAGGIIHFYDKTWTPMQNYSKFIHKNALAEENEKEFSNLGAIEYNEIDQYLYFVDREMNNNGSILSLKVANLPDTPHIVHHIDRIGDERIEGIAYDPLYNQIYWTDEGNGVIYRMVVNNSTAGVVEPFIKFNNNVKPHGITIDVCRRVLYFTNTYYNGFSIEKIELDMPNPKNTMLIQMHESPSAIVLSQKHQRIYWLEGRGSYVKILSANFTGGDVQKFFKKDDHNPVNFFVDDDQIYWTEQLSRSVWHVNMTGDQIPKNVTYYKEGIIPVGIINRNNFMETEKNNPACLSVIQTLRTSGPKPTTYKPTPPTSKPTSSTNKPTLPTPEIIVDLITHKVESPPETVFEKHCLNDQLYSRTTKECICDEKYSGKYCEIDKCRNFCLNDGLCSISPVDQEPQCKCNGEFGGKRCETNMCQNLCLNNGTCKVDSAGDTVCVCGEYFTGSNCDVPKTKIICAENLFDLNLFAKHNINKQICDRYQDSECRPNITFIVVIIISGILLSLVILYGILMSVRRMYKPLRPKVKKTYVVRKNFTPLTSRPNGPHTEQQCEITIENCCNMNICDTPCFDPKLLQGDVETTNSSTKPINGSNGKNTNAILVNYKRTMSKKDDKKQLLGDMDCNGGGGGGGDLY